MFYEMGLKRIDSKGFASGGSKGGHGGAEFFLELNSIDQNC